MDAKSPPPMSAARVREVYRRYSVGRPDLCDVILPDLLPHDVCSAYCRPPDRIRVLFVVESPPWSAGRREVAAPSDCLNPDYPYFWNGRYNVRHRGGNAPLSLGFAENLFLLLGLNGESRRENLDLFTGNGFFLVDTIKCVFRKNRRAAIPGGLVRLSAREILGREIAGLVPGYVVALGSTALAGLREIEPYANALAGVRTITEISGDLQEALFEDNRLLCLPYPGWRNRGRMDLIKAGFSAVRDLAA